MKVRNNISKDLIFAGTITGTKGFDGKMAVKSTPDHIKSIRIGSECYIGFSKSFITKYTLLSWKKSKKDHQFSVKGVSSKEDAIHFKEQAVFVHTKDIIQEEKDSYSIGTLLDCIVYDIKTGEIIGKMKDIYILPANDVWIVNTKLGELPIPFIDDVVKKVDIPNARIEIEMIDGLYELIDGNKDEQQAY